MELLTPAVMDSQAQVAQQLVAGIERVILGQSALATAVVTSLIGGGHVLLEGLPGLGKTELVKAIGALTGCRFSRVQFTPDVMPADITGTHVLEEGAQGRQMIFRPGPVFANVVLADEINRASPKTQAALLEAMAEGSVTVLGETRQLPAPFFVLATQNPVDLDGTYPLPEAQLDRFAVKLVVHGVSDEVLTELISRRPGGRPPAQEAVCGPTQLAELIAHAQRVVVPEAVARWCARLINATRPERPESPAVVREHVRWGASPRAALALAALARARALLAGRPAVGFADIRALAVPVLAHRVVCSYEAGLSGWQAAQVIEELLQTIAEVPE